MARSPIFPTLRAIRSSFRILDSGEAFLPTSQFAIGAAASAAIAKFIWNPANSTLSWDADGTGAGTPVLIATLSGVSALAASDITLN